MTTERAAVFLFVVFLLGRAPLFFSLRSATVYSQYVLVSIMNSCSMMLFNYDLPVIIVEVIIVF
jgi:hypothetical protein